MASIKSSYSPNWRVQNLFGEYEIKVTRKFGEYEIFLMSNPELIESTFFICTKTFKHFSYRFVESYLDIRQSANSPDQRVHFAYDARIRLHSEQPRVFFDYFVDLQSRK